MSDSPLRAFTLEEANGLIPRLTAEFGHINELRDQITAVAQALGGASVASQLLEHHRRPRPEEAEPAERLRTLADEIGRTLRRVQELGCVIKDVDQGLIDFHSEIGGRHVFLCWQFGEDHIGHFHGLDEGFAQRQPLGEGEPERPAQPHWIN